MMVYSSRFDKEFEVECLTLNDGKRMLSYQGLVQCFESLGDSARVTHNYVPTPPVFMWESIIEDDTGVRVDEIGSVNIEEEGDKIARSRVPETAKSRAFRVAISKYFGFPEDLGKAETAVVVEDAPEDIVIDDDGVVIEDAPAAPEQPVKFTRPGQNAKPAATDDPGEFLITFGKAMNGKKIKELTQSQREWLAGSDFNPRNDAGKGAREAAIAYLAANK